MWNSFQNNFKYLCFFVLSILISCTDTGNNTVASPDSTTDPSTNQTGSIAESSNEPTTFVPSVPEIKVITTKFKDEIVHYRRNKELNIASSRVYSELDPHILVSMDSSDELQLLHALYAGLTTLNPLTARARPSLAEYWQSSMQEEGLSYTFTLREVYWSNGQRLSAQHVQQSLLRIILNQQSNVFASVFAHSIRGGDQLQNTSLFENDEQWQEATDKVAIEVIDEFTVSITVSFAEVPLLKILAHPQAAILPIDDFRDSVHSFDLDPQTWNGIGPYVPHSIEFNVLHLKAREDFWSEVWVDQIQLYMGLSTDEQEKLYEEETVDWIVEYPDLIPIDNTGSEKLNNELTKDENHRQRLASESGYSSLILIDIPWTSVLHENFSRIDYRNIGSSLFENEITKRNRELHVQLIVDILAILQENITQGRHLQNTKSFFLPYQILQQSIDHAKHHTQQSKIIPINTRGELNVDGSDEDFEAEQKISEYVLLLYQYLQRENRVFRIAYDSPVLYEAAKLIKTQYLETGNIQVELIFADATLEDQEYDLLLRLFHPVLDAHYATILSLWYLDMKNISETSTKENLTGSIQNLPERFTQLKAIDRKTNIERYLVEWNKDIQQQRRFIPVWLYGRKNRIDTKEFQWWTAQEQNWHPLYP